MKKEFIQFIFFVLSIISFFIGTIAGIISLISYFIGSEVLIHSWTAVILFAAGTFFWVIPLQIIDWLHLIPVQRRMKRIVYPYLITIIQVSVFVYYMVKLNSHVADVVFTNIGLIIYSLVMVLFTKGLLTWLAKYVRKMQKNEQLVTIERQ